MAACRFYQNALRALSKNSWEKMTRSKANTSAKITYCLLSVLQMHSGKIDITIFLLQQIVFDVITNLANLFRRGLRKLKIRY